MKKIITFSLFIVLSYFASAQMLISGIFDAQPGSSGAKGYELYATNDIADLSIYGLGLASNGTGSNGQDYSFPAQALSAGTFIYVAADSTRFHDFFGFPADFISDVCNINGDDAIELYANDMLIDVFGEVDVDGTDTDWEYLDGWAYRKLGTTAAPTFMLNNWTYSGIDALQGGATNAEAPTPFPIGTYSLSANAIVAVDDFVETDINTPVEIPFLNNDIIPANTSLDISIITTSETNGSIDLNNNTYIYTPNDGYCGEDQYLYQICTLNDPNNCSEATIFITVKCPSEYPAYDIATVRSNDANGIPDSLGVTCQLEGVVYGVNIKNDGGLSFVIIDGNGDGIVAYSDSENFAYEVNEGDVVSVQGTIGQFNGLAEIILDGVDLLSSTGVLADPIVVSALNESTESQLVRLDNVQFVDEDQWDPMGSGFNVDVTNGVDTFQVRIDNDVELFDFQAYPEGAQYTIQGLGGQFDFNAPYDEGYQILPRYAEDIFIPTNTTTISWAKDINIFPNPVKKDLFVKMPTALDALFISNAAGQRLVEIKQPQLLEIINVNALSAGAYTITFVKNNKLWSATFVK